MSLDLFHPLIQTWFRGRFSEPTDPQRLGWPEIAAGFPTLIAAPTGSGKTLAAFLVCIDRLFRQALAGTLPEETDVLYISPLKALGNDIQRNLMGPLEQIMAAARAAGNHPQEIRVKVRSGDTPAHERAAMLKKPPHILVTTPESLYLLLTSARSRERLRHVKTVIVDEIHALVRDKRGSHLALSLERLEALCLKPPAAGEARQRRPMRIGLSATQKPIEDIARFLVGTRQGQASAPLARLAEGGAPLNCRIVDTGHLRALDLGMVVPDSALATVCSNEQWDELYKKLVAMIGAHRSTLIFVNTRRMAERISYRLRDWLGPDAVASHHGSLSRQSRLSTEERFKKGELKAVVATASLELGIDIGFIDLVCQIGSPRSIATFLQRVGRSGHRLGVIPKGRLLVLTRDELLEGMALIRAVHQGRLDSVEIPRAPLDILGQQIVAEVACAPRSEDSLFELCKGAWPYRTLARADFDRVVRMVSEGIAPGRSDGAYLHRDQISHQLRGRRAARLSALTSGGAIPETADYRVVTEHENAFVGTVNEDFAVESLAGDVFLLGNTSWRVRAVRGGHVIVADAEGAPANIPFWLGEAPGRTVELSEEVSRLREEIAERLNGEFGLRNSDSAMNIGSSGLTHPEFPTPNSKLLTWLITACSADAWQAQQAILYVAAQKAAVGFVPTQTHLLFERFFDDVGGMQLVIHAPFGSRINRAWGLALRKRFCRSFDFELQASADDNGIVLSLGPQHSFPLEEMFKMLSSKNARETLIQALLAAPMFQVRWRWNLTRSLAVLRMRGGKKVPPPLQRFKSDDLMSAVFPLQTACFEHRPPEVPIPDHPLIAQTLFDCLHEAMDVDRWEKVLTDIEAGRIRLSAKDTRAPSPFSHSILNANPYSFLDDAPLEERRARAVAVRRTLSVEDMRDLAKLDPQAIAQIEAEVQPVVRDAEELHDTLMSAMALTEQEGNAWTAWFETLIQADRACRIQLAQGLVLWTAAERVPLLRVIFPAAEIFPVVKLPAELEQAPELADAMVALMRGRMDIQGPVTAEKIARDLGVDATAVTGALQRLEAEGAALQGRYTENSLTDPASPMEWCERRILARIHRVTLQDARKRVQAVTPDVYWRFLLDYHHLLIGSHREGPLGLHEALGQLQGFEMPAGIWEMDILPGRLEIYQGEWLDQLSYSGELTWGRLKPPAKPEEAEPSSGGLTRVVPIALTFREDLPWLLPPTLGKEEESLPHARPDALTVYHTLKNQGALFFSDLLHRTGLISAKLEDALSELAAQGLITADGFSPIRGLVRKRMAMTNRSRWSRQASRMAQQSSGGRWTLFPGQVKAVEKNDRLQAWAWQLLRRYGIVFRDLLTRESVAPSWWELTPYFRKLEMRGDIRGGRFVAQVAGEQYALPEAIELLRRPADREISWAVIAAVDPLNLAGIITPGPRVPALRSNRLLLRNGKVVATSQGGDVHFLEEFSEPLKTKISRILQLQMLSLRESLLKELSEPVAY